MNGTLEIVRRARLRAVHNEEESRAMSARHARAVRLARRTADGR
jgi:hypothetical protein